jgi:hypothetical protein
MTKAKNVLPQDKGGEGEPTENKGESTPNGAEKKLQNDVDGSPDAGARQDALANGDGSAIDRAAAAIDSAMESLQSLDEVLFDKIGMQQVQRPDNPLNDVVMSIAVIETIKSIAVDAVREALPKMLAEVEAARLAHAERAAKEKQDAELAEQRKADQDQRNREKRQQREEQKAREKAAEARAVELEASADFYAHITGSEFPLAEIVARVRGAERLLVMFADGKRFNIDLKHVVTPADLKAHGETLLLGQRIDVPVDVPTDALTECWLIPVGEANQKADCGLRADLGSAIAIGGGRPVMFPAESIAWRC